MITFQVSFLLSFSLITNKKSEKSVKKEKPAKKAKKTKEKNIKPSSAKASKAKLPKFEFDSKIEEEPTPLPNYVIQVDEPVGVAHIEYILVPNRCWYQIDVICYGPVAKIYTRDGRRFLKTVVKENYAWVPVCMEHYLPHLPNEEILKLQHHVVDFVICTNPEKIGFEAKSDRTTMFYLRQEDVDANCFVDVFDEDPNLVAKTIQEKQKEALEKSIQDIILSCANYPTKESVSWLHYFDNFEKILYDIIYKIENHLPVNCMEFVPICPPVPQTNDDEEVKKDEECIPPKIIDKKDKTKKAKGKAMKTLTDASKKGDKSSKPKKAARKDNVEKKKSKPETTILNICVPGEIFFTDPDLVIYKSDINNSTLRNSFVVLSVSSLMTGSQKLFFNPIVVKVLKVLNLPFSVLQNLGFTDIYVTYKIPSIAQCKTAIKPLGECVKFYESHIFFTNEVPQIKVLEFLQINRLVLKIWGIRGNNPEDTNTTVKLFGENPSDAVNLSKILRCQNIELQVPKEEKLEVTLAVTSYDLSSLVKNTWTCREVAQCHMPGLTLFEENFENHKNSYNYTLNELNLMQKKAIETPLKENVLLENVTTLELEAHLLALQAPVVLHGFYQTYRRVFFILHDETKAIDIFNFILMYNDSFLTNPDIKNDEKERISLTGFILDDGKRFAFFVEGVVDGVILSLWSIIGKFETLDSQIFANSDCVFDERLYNCFMSLGGIYMIILKIPLENIFKNPLIYVEGNMPVHCLEAVKKLHLLFCASTSRSMFQYNLFPKPEELYSFDLEWGVPYKWKN